MYVGHTVLNSQRTVVHNVKRGRSIHSCGGRLVVDAFTLKRRLWTLVFVGPPVMGFVLSYDKCCLIIGQFQKIFYDMHTLHRKTVQSIELSAFFPES